MNSKHYETAAFRKFEAPEGFEFCGWRAHGPGVMLEGGVPRLLKSGPRKGEKTWRDGIVKILVTEDEAQDAFAQCELAGTCGECLGKRLVWSGWSSVGGSTFRKCTRCNGTGRAPGTDTKEAAE